MLCYSAMMAAFYAGENKVSYKTAKKIAAEYHDAVAIESRKPGKWPRIMPPLIVGAALGSLLIAGLVYPNVWSDWVLNHTVLFGRANEQTVPPDSRATGHRKASRNRHEAKAALAPHPVESQASLAPVATATAAPKSDVAGPAATPGTSIASTAPAAAAVSAETQKPAGVPEQRSQITVRYGDTLEKIAIRYFGSTSGLNALIAANPQLTDINRLTVGQVIYLPRGITPKASHDQTATVPPVRNAEDSSRR
jgi:LysM repeat protein